MSLFLRNILIQNSWCSHTRLFIQCTWSNRFFRSFWSQHESVLLLKRLATGCHVLMSSPLPLPSFLFLFLFWFLHLLLLSCFHPTLSLAPWLPVLVFLCPFSLIPLHFTSILNSSFQFLCLHYAKQLPLP